MKNPRWDHKNDYDFLKNDMRREVWAWEVLKRNDEYRADYKKYLAEKEKLGEVDPDCSITDTNYRPKSIYGYDPPKLPDESEKAWQLRCDKHGIVGRILSLSGSYGLQWGLHRMCAPDSLYDEGVAFTKSRKFPQIIECTHDFETVPTIEIADGEWAEGIIHPKRAVVVFDLSKSITSQMEDARKFLELRIKNFQIPVTESFGESKERWLIHCRVKDALDLNPKISGSDLAIPIVGEKNTHPATSKAGYDLKNRAEIFFTRAKHLSILMGVDVDKNSELNQ